MQGKRKKLRSTKKKSKSIVTKLWKLPGRTVLLSSVFVVTTMNAWMRTCSRVVEAISSAENVSKEPLRWPLAKAESI